MVGVKVADVESLGTNLILSFLKEIAVNHVDDQRQHLTASFDDQVAHSFVDRDQPENKLNTRWLHSLRSNCLDDLHEQSAVDGRKERVALDD